MIEDLNEFLHREPFVPFRIVLTSGTSYEVRNPDQVVVLEVRLRYYYFGIDGYAVIRLNQLAAIETIGPKSGRGRRIGR